MDILNGLNPAQREAVETIGGPVLIVAGPGSGKTRVIAHRIAYLVKVCGISPYRILAVTFTNKAAREMRERVYQLVGTNVQDITLGTFHAVCARFLRAEAPHLGLDKHFVIYDADDQLSLIRQSIQEVGLDVKQYPPKGIQAAISAAKSRLLVPRDYAQVIKSYREEVVSRVYERYQELLAKSNALDFDDLLMRTVHLFRDHSEVLSKYQSRYVHVLVDEFQDTNIAQYMLAKQLAGKYRNICVVGDPDQSIYSWRFADLRNILGFKQDFPEVKVVLLEQNYRSTKTILETAEHVIAVNKERHPRRLWTENESGVPVVIAETYNEQEEAQFVVSEIEKLMDGGQVQAGDCAVMYRTNAQSRVIEEAFVRYGLPYRLVGGTRFYQRREVKDVIAYLRLISNPHDNVSLARIINVPPRNIGQRTMDELTRWAQKSGVPLYSAIQVVAQKKDEGKEALAAMPFTPRTVQSLASFLDLLNSLIAEVEHRDLVSLLDVVLERTGYKQYILDGDQGEERWENVLELRTVAAQYQDLEPADSLAALLEEIALVSDVDEMEGKANAVTLITLHQAKGLEFPIVFIVGVEEGLLPHIRSFDNPAQMEEERRLCYVGITRAQKQVYLVRTFRRALMGSSKPSLPSRFLGDIPSRLAASPGQKREIAKVAVSPRPEPVKKVSPLNAGARVRHPKFGEGIVVSCTPASDDYEVVVAFKEGAGVKKLLMTFANLEKMG